MFFVFLLLGKFTVLRVACAHQAADICDAGVVNYIWFNMFQCWSSIRVQLAHSYFWAVYLACKMNHAVEGMIPGLALWGVGRIQQDV